MKEVNKTIQSKDEEGNQIFNERIRMDTPDGVHNNKTFHWNA